MSHEKLHLHSEKSVKSSRQKYGTYLDEQKKSTVQSEKSRKRNAKDEKIVEVKRKKNLLLDTVIDLHTKSDKYATGAENTDTLETVKSLLAKSNSFRAAKEK